MKDRCSLTTENEAKIPLSTYGHVFVGGTQQLFRQLDIIILVIMIKHSECS